MYGSVLCANKDWALNKHNLVQTNNCHKHVLTETGMAVLIVCVTRRRKCSSPLTPRSEHCALSQTPTLIWTVCIIVIDILRTISLSLQWKVLSQTVIPSIACHSMSSFHSHSANPDFLIGVKEFEMITFLGNSQDYDSGGSMCNTTLPARKNTFTFLFLLEVRAVRHWSN